MTPAIKKLRDAMDAARATFNAKSLLATQIAADLCRAEDEMVAAEDAVLSAELAYDTAREREYEAQAAAEDAAARLKDDAREEAGYLWRKQQQEAKP
jgi:hypothetical protein